MMREIFSGLRKFNEHLCSVDGILRGFCKDSITPGKVNHLFLVGASLFIQYLLPIIAIFLVLVVLLGNAIGIGLIVLLYLFNPVALLALIPVLVLDIGLAIVFFVAMLAITVVYCIYFFKKISYFSLLPLVMWVAAFVLGFIPYVGNMVASIIGIMPWMAIAVGLHWFSYRSQ